MTSTKKGTTAKKIKKRQKKTQKKSQKKGTLKSDFVIDLISLKELFDKFMSKNKKISWAKLSPKEKRVSSLEEKKERHSKMKEEI